MQDTYYNTPLPHKTPRDFWVRRLHSFTGFCLILFLIEHLLTNSQAALFIGDDGAGFIQAVNFLKSLPYLPVIEIVLLGFPILFHAWYGMVYLRQAKNNSLKSDGSTPSLPELPRNQAFTWQRITALLLVVGIVAHVLWMRFLNDPVTLHEVHQKFYQVNVTMDEGLIPLTERLNVLLEEGENGLLAIADNPGTAILLVVRDTFKSLLLCLLYTFFVVAASFHAMNGLWTFCISWGVMLNERSRIFMRILSSVGMLLLSLLGLAAIWLTYWVNLRN